MQGLSTKLIPSRSLSSTLALLCRPPLPRPLITSHVCPGSDHLLRRRRPLRHGTPTPAPHAVLNLTRHGPPQDGTLTDSIAAVEAAWGKVATDIGQDPAFVIAATHGKRAVDNLAQFKPHIQLHEMDAEVQAFEKSILFFADAYARHGPGSRASSSAPTPPLATPSSSDDESSASSTSSLSSASSRAPSFGARVRTTSGRSRRPSFARRLSNRLRVVAAGESALDSAIDEESEGEDASAKDIPIAAAVELQLKAWQVEAAAVDRSVRILPGVKRLMGSIPDGRYAVATSGAKTYGKSTLLSEGRQVG